VTDTAHPITEPHLTPMFATGAQPVASTNTQPHPAPIFDTGPHPDPLQSASEAATDESESESGAGEREASQATAAAGEVERIEDSGEWASAEWDSDEWRSAEWRNPDPEPAEAEAAAVVSEAADLGLALDAIDGEAEPSAPQAFSELENVDTDAFLRSVTGHMPPVVVPAHPVAVPGSYQFLKRWKFALIVAGVWLLAAAAGLGFYYWWYTALDKTLPVLGIWLYVVVCMVASMLVSMVPNRPQITALAIALMAAPLASMAAAAVLHGAYFFEWITRPTIG
jgi:hypothetical protein